MLLNKYQHQQDRERRRCEDRRRHDEDHWRCPFFAFCWNEGLILPSTDNCPECNGSHDDSRSSKRQCHDDRDRRLISRDRHEKRVSVHDWLGGRVKVQDRLEDMASDLVPDEEPLNHEIEHQRNYRYDPILNGALEG
jgi:hypothetical protein